MIVDIQTRELRTIAQLRAFVEGNGSMDFQPQSRDGDLRLRRDTLERFGYRRLALDPQAPARQASRNPGPAAPPLRADTGTGS